MNSSTFSVMNISVLCFALMLLCSGQDQKQDIGLLKKTVENPLPDEPNILWLVTEDMGSYIPSFGDSTTATPPI